MSMFTSSKLNTRLDLSTFFSLSLSATSPANVLRVLVYTSCRDSPTMKTHTHTTIIEIHVTKNNNNYHQTHEYLEKPINRLKSPRNKSSCNDITSNITARASYRNINKMLQLHKVCYKINKRGMNSIYYCTLVCAHSTIHDTVIPWLMSTQPGKRLR